jgi:hypothetical protein
MCRGEAVRSEGQRGNEDLCGTPQHVETDISHARLVSCEVRSSRTEAGTRPRSVTQFCPGDLRRFSIRSWEQLGNNNAQTPGKTRVQGRPESRTNQQDRRPGPVCKTSIPGSNPGGASKILQKSASFVPWRHKQVFANVPKLRAPEQLHLCKCLIPQGLRERAFEREEVCWTSAGPSSEDATGLETS